VNFVERRLTDPSPIRSRQKAPRSPSIWRASGQTLRYCLPSNILRTCSTFFRSCPITGPNLAKNSSGALTFLPPSRPPLLPAQAESEGKDVAKSPTKRCTPPPEPWDQQCLCGMMPVGSATFLTFEFSPLVSRAKTADPVPSSTPPPASAGTGAFASPASGAVTVKNKKKVRCASQQLLLQLDLSYRECATREKAC